MTRNYRIIVNNRYFYFSFMIINPFIYAVSFSVDSDDTNQGGIRSKAFTRLAV